MVRSAQPDAACSAAVHGENHSEHAIAMYSRSHS
jgi:hypothetical protein